MNSIVTPAMFAIMRNALGLGIFHKRPTTNNVIPKARGGSADDALIEQMIDMELLTRTERTGPAGRVYHVMVTDEGTRLTVEDMVKYHAIADQVKEDLAKEHFSKLGSKRKPYIADAYRIHDETLKRMAEIEAE